MEEEIVLDVSKPDFAPEAPSADLAIPLPSKLALASLCLWFCLSILLIMGTAAYFSEEPVELVLNSGETRLITPNNYVHLRMSLTDHGTHTVSYVVDHPPSRVVGPRQQWQQSVHIPYGHWHEWSRFFLSSSSFSLWLMPSSPTPFQLCIVQGQQGYDDYLEDGTCNAYSALIDPHGIHDPKAHDQPVTSPPLGFNVTYLTPVDDVYYVILENQYEVKHRQVLITANITPMVHAVHDALDYERGSWKKDLPFLSPSYFVITSHSTSTVTYQFESRAAFVWLVFAFIDVLVLLLVIACMMHMQTRLSAPQSPLTQPISKGLQLLIMGNQQGKKEYASISFNSHLAIQHQITKSRAGLLTAT
jgi:hypothetical protein